VVEMNLYKECNPFRDMLEKSASDMIGVRELGKALDGINEGRVSLDTKICILNTVVNDIHSVSLRLSRFDTAKESLELLENCRKEVWLMACSACLDVAWCAIDSAISNAVQNAKGGPGAKYVIETAAKMFAESLLMKSFPDHTATSRFMNESAKIWNGLRTSTDCACGIRTKEQ
jgi:hypothetical protein